MGRHLPIFTDSAINEYPKLSHTIKLAFIVELWHGSCVKYSTTNHANIKQSSIAFGIGALLF
jgi:hypothetical protein